MVCMKISLVFIFFAFYNQKAYSDDIAEDYYFGLTSLRSDSKTLSCHDEVSQYLCHVQCGRNHACVHGVCYCLVADDPQGLNPLTNKDDYEQLSDVVDYNDVNALLKKFKNNNEYMYAQRPTLRHHIAHFCPNLDVARTCIRKCMAVGKPAFCGKDHVCYCGHKGENLMSESKIDKLAMQKDFKDMYKKYLGTKRHRHAIEDVTMPDSSSSERNEQIGT